MKYRVTLLQLVQHEVEIGADNPEDALLRARTLARLDMTKHHTVGYELAGCEESWRRAVKAATV